VNRIQFEILTLFPEYFHTIQTIGIIKRGVDRGLLCLHTHNPRDFTGDKHRTVDDTPYGGGAGMVMKPEPIFDCLDSLGEPRPFRILLSPQGTLWTQEMAKDLVMKHDRIALICGRYEGVDERVRMAAVDLDLSIGDYVIAGGEAAAWVVIETLARLIAGVVGDAESVTSDSLNDHLLKYPQYTRPVEYRGMRVPEVLLSGHHEKVDEWRHKKAVENTRSRRPDLFTCKRDTENDRRSVCRSSDDA
jgi:tRNA (guanine37-N1)-methyltransferase